MPELLGVKLDHSLGFSHFLFFILSFLSHKKIICDTIQMYYSHGIEGTIEPVFQTKIIINS